MTTTPLGTARRKRELTPGLTALCFSEHDAAARRIGDFARRVKLEGSGGPAGTVEISAVPDRALAARLAGGCPHNATAVGDVNVRQETEAARRKDLRRKPPGLTA